MEINLDTIINVLSLLLGGGGGALFTWRYLSKRAKAEAQHAEADAKSAEIDMVQKVQDTYQQMLEDKNKEVEDNHRLIEELRQDRDHYKAAANELRSELEKLTKQFLDFKIDNERTIIQMQRDIARNGRMVECMRPLLCGREGCAIRVPVTISSCGKIDTIVDSNARQEKKEKDIEPINNSEL